MRRQLSRDKKCRAGTMFRLWAGWRVALLALCAGAFLSSCGSSNRFSGLGSEGDFLSGKELYDKGRCFKAAEVFETFLAQHPGSARVDDAIYYLGLSRKCLGEYILAREEFDRLLREFPQSENREASEFNKALCFYETRYSPDRDSEPTERAVAAYEIYLRHYPTGEFAAEARDHIRICKNDLAIKEYENGKTYIMLKRWDAALIYFEKSLETLPDSEVADRNYVEIARCLASRPKPAPERAREWHAKFVEFATPERKEQYGGLDRHLRQSEKWVEKAQKWSDRLARELEEQMKELER